MPQLVNLFYHVVAQDGGAELLRDTTDEPVEPMLRVRAVKHAVHVRRTHCAD